MSTKNRGDFSGPKNDASHQESNKYAITLSSNYARHKNAYKAYKYVIKRFPEGTFKYIHELSKNGKYHVHGIMVFKYKFNFINLKKSLETSNGRQFDIHVHYEKIGTYADEAEWYTYSGKLDPAWKTHTIDSNHITFGKSPDTCIPEVTVNRVYKTVYIPGL